MLWIDRLTVDARLDTTVDSEQKCAVLHNVEMWGMQSVRDWSEVHPPGIGPVFEIGKHALEVLMIDDHDAQRGRRRDGPA